jgi:aminoglycoside phosphotransferase (APT) family kinase protein
MTASNLIDHDVPSADFVQDLRRRYPTERETDELLLRKVARRTSGPYRRHTLSELEGCLRSLLEANIDGHFEVLGARWFTGGVSKIQMGFTLRWDAPGRGPSEDRMVVRMEPSESLNATSRVREFELLRLFDGVLPVPATYWIDAEGQWFPEPALVYAFVDGVAKPTGTTSGQVTGLGTVFGSRLREILAPQFMDALARIHTLDVTKATFTSLDVPEVGSTDGALWQLNRARRVWEEDRGEDFPLMEVAANWLERNLPPLDHVGVVHGDFRSGNFLFDEPSGRITAWLDWERGHLGDRHRDLAWTTQLTFGHYDESSRGYYVCGLVPLDEFYDRYSDVSGLSVDPERLRYYQILNSYQIIVALLGTAYRVIRLGKSHQGLLLARLKGEVAPIAHDLRQMLAEAR